MLKKLSVLVLLLSSVTMAHDMWLEPDRFVFGTGDLIAIRNGNGTIYQKTENAVLPDRITSLFGIGPDGQRITVGDPVAEDKWTRFNFAAKRAGNYWVAMGTRPRMIRLSGKDFTEYLEHDGIPEVLKERAEKGISDRDEIEQYSKYVKTYLQVGEQRSSNYKDPVGLAIEIVPLANPYELRRGDVLPLQVLFKGKPLSGLAIHAGAYGEGEALAQLTSDENGQAQLKISQPGKWYVRGIHLSQVDLEDHSYESYWATLTFAVP